MPRVALKPEGLKIAVHVVVHNPDHEPATVGALPVKVIDPVDDEILNDPGALPGVAVSVPKAEVVVTTAPKNAWMEPVIVNVLAPQEIIPGVVDAGEPEAAVPILTYTFTHEREVPTVSVWPDWM